MVEFDDPKLKDGVVLIGGTDGWGNGNPPEEVEGREVSAGLPNENPGPEDDPKLPKPVAAGFSSGFGSLGFAPKGFEDGAPKLKGAGLLLTGVVGWPNGEELGVENEKVGKFISGRFPFTSIVLRVGLSSIDISLSFC